MRSQRHIVGPAMVGLAVGAILLSACAKGTKASAQSGSPGQKGSQVATANVSGVGTVLVNGQGFTLYHLTTEKAGQIHCTGSCATVWPPLISSGTPGSVAGASGTFGTVTRPDGGTQLTYNGMPLYRYSGDTKAGQANGQGIQGVWFAVTASGSSSSSSSPAGGGY